MRQIKPALFYFFIEAQSAVLGEITYVPCGDFPTRYYGSVHIECGVQ